MPQFDIRRFSRPQLFTFAGVIAAFALLGLVILATSHADAPSQAIAANRSAGLLKPVHLGMAPYQYVAYSGSLSETRQRTGVSNIIAGFIINTGDCKPSWGGMAAGELSGKRAAAIADDITKLRASGAEATISFGGSNGTELASACKTTADLSRAYQQVIDTYSASRLDFDVEATSLQDKAGANRRAEAAIQLQKNNPGLQVWVTLPVRGNGLTAEGLTVLESMQRRGVVVSGVNIMAMNYNNNVQDMGAQAVMAATATHGQLKKLYPDVSDADVWKAMGVTVMVGHNDTPNEVFTLANAMTVGSFVRQHNVGMVSFWNADRDKSCPEGTPLDQANISCSGIDQQPDEFLKSLSL